MARLAVALRVVILVPLLIGVVGGAGTSTRLGLYLAVSGAVVVTSAWMIVSALRRGTLLVGGWRIADLALGLVALPALAMALPVEQLVGTQVGWANGYAINVAALAGGYLPRAAAIGYGLAAGAMTFVVSRLVPTATPYDVVGNALVPVAFAVASTMFAAFFRDLGRSVDEARAAEVRATKALELERYRLTVHDATGILRLLADEATPAEVRPALQRQAAAEANRLRGYLRDGQAHPDGNGIPTLGSVLEEAICGFSDLPLEVSTDLGGRVALPAEQGLALGRAVATVLHNVRRHARAEIVYVHADVHGSEWEVVVRDDGTGFDPAIRELGFGLQVQVVQALRSAGMTCRID
ncbi:MAG: hypothetical protein ACOYBY_19465, partial [Dermatophilaceae bacterium]